MDTKKVYIMLAFLTSFVLMISCGKSPKMSNESIEEDLAKEEIKENGKVDSMKFVFSTKKDTTVILVSAQDSVGVVRRDNGRTERLKSETAAELLRLGNELFINKTAEVVTTYEANPNTHSMGAFTFVYKTKHYCGSTTYSLYAKEEDGVLKNASPDYLYSTQFLDLINIIHKLSDD